MGLKEFQVSLSRLMVLLAVLVLTACGYISSSMQKIQGESSLFLSGSASLEDLIFLSLEHSTSSYTAAEDLHDLGSDIVVYDGREGEWQICLQGEFEFVSAELSNSNSGFKSQDVVRHIFLEGA